MDRLELRDRQHFGVVRDPWSWYPSLYRHAILLQANRGGDWARAHVSAGGGVGFDSWLRSVLARPFLPPIGIWETDPARPPPNGEEGLWSWLVRYMYQDSSRNWLVPTLIDAAHLRAGLEAVVGGTVDVGRHPIHNAANSRENRSEQPALTDYRSWWDDDAIRLVEDADAGLVEEIGYRPFESRASVLFCPCCRAALSV